MGLGDSKLAGVLGTALGWFSWTTLLTATLLTFLTAALSLLLHRLHRRTPTREIPLGPALVIGTFTALLIVPSP